MTVTEYLPRLCRWNTWYQGSYCKILIDNSNWLEDKGITLDRILDDVVPNPSNDERNDFLKLKEGIQRGTVKSPKL